MTSDPEPLMKWNLNEDCWDEPIPMNDYRVSGRLVGRDRHENNRI